MIVVHWLASATSGACRDRKMPVQRHIVVIPREDGGVELFPLKEWLRRNPEETPSGLDPTMSTSHQLRSGLRRMGWTMQQTPTEIRLVKPGAEKLDIVDEVLGSDEDFQDNVGSAAFSLEYQLRDFLAANLAQVAVNGVHLRLYVDLTGREGIEYPTAVGPIDILAVDEKGSFFVFELKRANSHDHAVGQVARYMGWIRQTIGKDRDVFGVIVAKAISEKLRYAASGVPNLYLFEYDVEFHLRSANKIV